MARKWVSGKPKATLSPAPLNWDSVLQNIMGTKMIKK